jgi:hypothetical protein
MAEKSLELDAGEEEGTHALMVVLHDGFAEVIREAAVAGPSVTGGVAQA